MGNIFTKDNNSQKINYNGKFWKFYGILIPINVVSIPSIDKVNQIVERGGGETLLCGIDIEPYTLEEYQKKYSIVGIDGKLYWKE